MNEPMSDERVNELTRMVNRDVHAFLLRECVDEIRRLRAEVAEWKIAANKHLDELYKLRPEVERLKEEVTDQKRYNETHERMWNKIDEHLPEWVGTGKGRIDVIEELKAEVERLKEELEEVKDELSAAIESQEEYLKKRPDLWKTQAKKYEMVLLKISDIVNELEVIER